MSLESSYKNIVDYAKRKAGNYDKVKFRYTYSNYSTMNSAYGIERVVSIVLADFKKNKAKIKSIVYYKDGSKRRVRIKVLCKRDLEVEDYKYKFSDNLPRYKKLQNNIKSLFENHLFYSLNTNVYSNPEDLVYKTFNTLALPNDYYVLNKGIGVKYKYEGTYLGDDVGYNTNCYVDRQDF